VTALICDTGPILAALDAADPDHHACAELLASGGSDLIVPTLVLSEVDYWCHERLTAGAWLAFLDDVLAGVYRNEPPTLHDLDRCRELQERYRDLKLGVVDASVIALAERLGEKVVATLDHRHFGVVRPRHVKAFRLLP
jgi:predicted nucleic acid-binding protein